MKQALQANISGYMGKSCSLFGVLDTDTGVLHILKQASKFKTRTDDFVLITNMPRSDNDFYIDDAMLLESIQSYYRLKNSVASDAVTPLLNIGDKIGGADPQSSIDIAGVDTHGMDYRISPDIKNTQVAVLAMCLYAERSDVVRDALEMMNSFDKMFFGAFTI